MLKNNNLGPASQTGTEIAIKQLSSGSDRWNLRLNGSGGWNKFQAGPNGGRHDCSTDRHRGFAAWSYSLYKHLYVQVLVAIAAGILLGHFTPNWERS